METLDKREKLLHFLKLNFMPLHYIVGSDGHAG